MNSLFYVKNNTKIESVAEIIVLLNKKTIFHFFFSLLNQLKQ